MAVRVCACARALASLPPFFTAVTHFAHVRQRTYNENSRKNVLEPRVSALQPLTSLLGRLVVGLADQPAVLHQVILVARGQLPLTYDAGEAVQVVDEVLRPPHHLRGGDPLLAGRTFGPESPL